MNNVTVQWFDVDLQTWVKKDGLTDHQAAVLRRKLRQGGTDKYRHDTAYYENVEG